MQCGAGSASRTIVRWCEKLQLPLLPPPPNPEPIGGVHDGAGVGAGSGAGAGAAIGAGFGAGFGAAAFRFGAAFFFVTFFAFDLSVFFFLPAAAAFFFFADFFFAFAFFAMIDLPISLSIFTPCGPPQECDQERPSV